MTNTQTAASPTLSVSIVVYRSALKVLGETLSTLLSSVVHAAEQEDLSSASVAVVLNAPADSDMTTLLQRYQAEAAAHGVQVSIIEGHGNVGYGRGHNLAVLGATSDYHLILNPDVQLAADTLSEGLRFMAKNREIAALSPAVFEEDGRKQYACKRFPSVFDFLIRGFAPSVLKRLFAKRLAHYEMQDLSEQRPSTDIPIISGCFMLFRTQSLLAVNGFDERYFLYFEDFDLSLRMHNKGALAYVPAMRIVHLGGNSAKKGLRHIGMFARSGLRFYNTHGWRLL